MEYLIGIGIILFVCLLVLGYIYLILVILDWLLFK